MKSLSGGSGSIERIQLLLESLDLRGRDGATTGNAQLAAQVEQLVLNLGETGAHCGRQAAGYASNTPIALLSSSTAP